MKSHIVEAAVREGAPNHRDADSELCGFIVLCEELSVALIASLDVELEGKVGIQPVRTVRIVHECDAEIG